MGGRPGASMVGMDLLKPSAVLGVGGPARGGVRPEGRDTRQHREQEEPRETPGETFRRVQKPVCLSFAIRLLHHVHKVLERTA